MNESLKQTLIRTLLVTVVAVNMMLSGMLVARSQVEPGGTAPVMGQPGNPVLQKEYRMDYEGVTREGDWRVEHYRMVEVLRDPEGDEVRTRPTREKTHLRYWEGEGDGS